MDYREARLILNLLPGIGPVKAARLLERFREPEAIFAASAPLLSGIPGIGPKLIHTLCNWSQFCDVDAEWQHLEKLGLQLICPEDAHYPSALQQLYDPPIVLYCKGQLIEQESQCIAIVGLRNATHYGLHLAKKFAYQLAFQGYSVVSGLARGIDTAAHEGALAAKGRTLAILGSGIAQLYPPENQALAERISTNGAVISEFPIHLPPDRTTFPQRNRIVSGLSCATLVVEAGIRSGALITAQQALEQNKQVFVIPGNIDKPTSQGCNRLIQEGATLVTCVEDLLEELGQQRALNSSTQNAKVMPELSPEEHLIFETLGAEEMHINELTLKCNLPISNVLAGIMKLEMKHQIQALPGKFYIQTKH